MYRSDTSPLATSAVSTAEGPGSTVTGTPAANAARTSSAPGSEIPGIPASETRATLSPASSLGISSATRRASLCSCEETSRRGNAVAVEEDSRVAGVLGEHDVRGTKLIEDAERHVAERFPIGVAQTTSGIGATPRRAPRRRRGRLRSGPPRAPSSAMPSRARSAPGSRASLITTSRAGPSSWSPAATPKPPPISTTSGPNRLMSEATAMPRCLPICASAGCRCSTRSSRGRVGAEHLTREAIRSMAGAIGLDVAVPGTRALARLTVLDDHHVPCLRPASV